MLKICLILKVNNTLYRKVRKYRKTKIIYKHTFKKQSTIYIQSNMKRIYIFSPFVRRSTNGSSYSELDHSSLLPHPHPNMLEILRDSHRL